MPNLNKVMLMGNLTRDPELRYTPKGTAVTDVGMAINRYFSGDDGQRREETTFVDVTLWGRQAEIVCQYCGKGRPLFVEGRLNLDSWEDRNSGQQRTKLKVVGEAIQLIGGREGAGGGYSTQGGDHSAAGPGYSSGPSEASYAPPPQSSAQPAQQSYPPQDQGPMGGGNDEEDDIPF